MHKNMKKAIKPQNNFILEANLQSSIFKVLEETLL